VTGLEAESGRTTPGRGDSESSIASTEVEGLYCADARDLSACLVYEEMKNGHYRDSRLQGGYESLVRKLQGNLRFMDSLDEVHFSDR